MNQDKANTTASVNSEAVDLNAALLSNKVREPKLYKFADGEFKVPQYYYCTKCGKKHAVARQTLINRVNNQFGGKLKDYLANAVGSDCKREARVSQIKISDEEIIRRYEALMAAKKDTVVENNEPESNIE